MGIITKIEDQKNKKRFNIFVDNAFFCGLMKETAVMAGLKEGKEVDEEALNKIIFDSEVKRAFEKASSYLASREHSKKELISKLLTKGFDKDVAKEAVLKLEEYHYVDDFLFAKHYLEQNHKYSKLILENKLKEKGVEKEIIAQVFEEFFDEDEETKLLDKQIAKYIASKDMTKEGAKDKLKASLLRKGFGFDDVSKAMKKFCFNNDEDFG